MTYAEAERYLLSLELFGMRFGLDRMRRLMTALGSPQERYGRIDDADLSEARFAAAVTRAARAADKVNRTLEEGDRVTQFEALTAAAYSELAEAGVDVAVIEAGLGGRYDATNVIPSRVQVLTNVGLEHTRWLGPTIADISREKLAVVRDDSTLVVGKLEPAAAAEARAAARAHRARLVKAPPSWTGGPLAARGGFQRANFALARAAAEA